MQRVVIVEFARKTFRLVSEMWVYVRGTNMMVTCRYGSKLYKEIVNATNFQKCFTNGWPVKVTCTIKT